MGFSHFTWKGVFSQCTVAAGVLLVGAAGGQTLAAQNLVVNSHFDHDLSGWEAVGPSAWNGALDAEQSPSSGAAQGTFDSATVTGTSNAVAQCVPISLGATYQIGGKVYIPAGQAVAGSAFYLVVIFPTTGCSGPPPPGVILATPEVTTVGAWTSSTSTIVASYGQSAMIYAAYQPLAGGVFKADFDDVVFTPVSTGCVANAQTLCLQDLRFKVTATFDTGDGVTRAANMVPIGDSGYLWFFDPGNIEAVVKIIDGCYLGDHYWFFAAGLTNVNVVIAVTDLTTGTVRTYTNTLNTPFPPIQDTSAFSCG